MTRRKAVGIIISLLDVGGSDGFDNEDKEALNMAIEALESISPCDLCRHLYSDNDNWCRECNATMIEGIDE